MYLNVDRIAVLAGLGKSESSGLMREALEATPAKAPVKPGSAAPAPAAPTATLKPAAPTATSKPAAAPTDASKKPVKEYDMISSGFDDEFGMDGGMDDDMAMYEEADETESAAYETAYADEESMVYEVDEEELMEALVDMRQTRLNESRVRSTVRTEIEDILNEMESGSRWLYGNRKPTKANGNVTRGFLGPGFR